MSRSELESRGMITADMIGEWGEITSTPGNYSAWTHKCKDKEPRLFAGFWETYIRLILSRLAQEMGPGVNVGVYRSLEQACEQCLYMGYFFAERRMTANLDQMGIDVEIDEDPTPPGPDTGGLDFQDFLL